MFPALVLKAEKTQTIDCVRVVSQAMVELLIHDVSERKQPVQRLGLDVDL